MDFARFDTRRYPTISVRDGYGEWAPTFETVVQDEMDLRLLERDVRLLAIYIHDLNIVLVWSTTERREYLRRCPRQGAKIGSPQASMHGRRGRSWCNHSGVSQCSGCSSMLTKGLCRKGGRCGAAAAVLVEASARSSYTPSTETRPNDARRPAARMLVSTQGLPNVTQIQRHTRRLLSSENRRAHSDRTV